MSTLNTVNITNGTDSITVEGAVKGSAKAWVNFNGTGTVAIRASYNVSSITDNGVGDYTVNFTNALVDTNYAVTALAGTATVTFGIVTQSSAGGSRASGSYRFRTTDQADTTQDSSVVNVAIFR